ncbi:MAG: hypothetical protein AAF560_32675, partial [Acidobacteriota bacterium]
GTVFLCEKPSKTTALLAWFLKAHPEGLVDAPLRVRKTLAWTSLWVLEQDFQVNHSSSSFGWIVATFERGEVPPDPTLIGIEYDLTRVGLAEELEDLSGRLALDETANLVERPCRAGRRRAATGQQDDGEDGRQVSEK